MYVNESRILDGRVRYFRREEGGHVTSASLADQTDQVVCNSFPTPPGRVGYDSNCPACYLGHAHTVAYHVERRAAYIEASRPPAR